MINNKLFVVKDQGYSCLLLACDTRSCPTTRAYKISKHWTSLNPKHLRWVTGLEPTSLTWGLRSQTLTTLMPRSPFILKQLHITIHNNQITTWRNWSRCIRGTIWNRTGPCSRSHSVTVILLFSHLIKMSTNKSKMKLKLKH